VPLELASASAAASQSVLSTEEVARAKSFVVERPRRNYLASRAALRSLLGRYLGKPPSEVTILIDVSGKPRLADGDLRFNLAHSGELALIAFTRDCEIGVDLELVRPIERALEIAARNFHPAELAAIRDASAEELAATFFRCWTRKEAVLKAVGLGLIHPLDELNTHLPNGGSCVEVPGAASQSVERCWLQDVAPCSGYVGSVVTLQPRGHLQGFTYSP
jgi:4'-phosphopantetheinyl transferase